MSKRSETTSNQSREERESVKRENMNEGHERSRIMLGAPIGTEQGVSERKRKMGVKLESLSVALKRLKSTASQQT